MSAANPKFKMGDVLQLTDYTVHFWKVIAFQVRDGIDEYVLQRIFPDGAIDSSVEPMAISIDALDADPDWHLKTTPPPPGITFPWIWVGVGGAVAVLGTLVFLRMRRPQ